jgi:hypothetical protein
MEDRARDFLIRNLHSEIRNRMAERVGFEPTVRFPVHSISSAASSTTPAPLREQRMKMESRQDERASVKQRSTFYSFFIHCLTRSAIVTKIKA